MRTYTEDMKFEWVNNIIYLGVKINALGYPYIEIQMGINVTKKSIFALKTVFKSNIMSIRTNLTLYKIMIYLIALFLLESGTIQVMDEKSLGIFKRITQFKYLALKKSRIQEIINETLIRK